MRHAKTSASHPMRIDSVTAGNKCGRIGLTFCPGKKQRNAETGTWDRDLSADLEAVRNFGAKALVTLMPEDELQSLGVSGELLRAASERMNIEWYQLPIPDAGIPGQDFERVWVSTGRRLREVLREGSHIVIHCKGGLGRTGMIAARLLVELGADEKEAMQSVRRVRPGAIETSQQEEYILTLKKRRDYASG